MVAGQDCQKLFRFLLFFFLGWSVPRHRATPERVELLVETLKYAHSGPEITRHVQCGAHFPAAYQDLSLHVSTKQAPQSILLNIHNRAQAFISSCKTLQLGTAHKTPCSTPSSWCSVCKCLLRVPLWGRNHFPCCNLQAWGLCLLHNGESTLVSVLIGCCDLHCAGAKTSGKLPGSKLYANICCVDVASCRQPGSNHGGQ